MKEKYRAPKGFQDIFPPDTFVWGTVLETAGRIFRNYGYHEIKVPAVEHTEIFVRSIGESTDIVEKEMYTFNDRAGRSLTLRPEGTASVVRCYVQNGLFNRTSPQKYFYTGPMFRYERPQKGRLRQFYQIGAEAFGVEDPVVDAEMLGMLRDFFGTLGLQELTFEVNSIGCKECRGGYKKALKGFISERLQVFCDDCKRRYDTNPLRILDCKVPSCGEASKDAPVIMDHICDDCGRHFEAFRGYLDVLGITYMVNARLVRGLDYYTRTTFEITTTQLGAQNAVTAGGRYDGLVEEFGGPSTPAIGFAVGIERLAELVSGLRTVDEPKPDLFVACLNHQARTAALRITEKLRKEGIWCEMSYNYVSLRNQLKRADRAGAGVVFIIGEDELEAGNCKYRRLSDGREGYLPLDDYAGMVGLLTDLTLNMS